MHTLHKLVKEVDKTHPGLGKMIAWNVLAAKAKKCLLNIAPANCGKSTATDTVWRELRGITRKYTSMTLAGLRQIAGDLKGFAGHIIIDDLGTEKSYWSRTSTVTVLANLVYTGYVYKVTQQYVIEITDFQGSAAINIQPILMRQLVQDDDWIAVVRDKTIRYYHLKWPRQHCRDPPKVHIDWGTPLKDVKFQPRKGKAWYQLLAYGLVQWSHGRCNEHIPDLLRACAALDNRERVNKEDYEVLTKLMKPLTIERYIIESYGLEVGRNFLDDVFCLLIELATDPEVPIETICEDYKVSPKTIERIVQDKSEWFWIKKNSPRRLCPTDFTREVLRLAGAYDKW